MSFILLFCLFSQISAIMYNRGLSLARLIVPENATCINYKQGAFKNNIRPPKIQDTLMGVPQGGSYSIHHFLYKWKLLFYFWLKNIFVFTCVPEYSMVTVMADDQSWMKSILIMIHFRNNLEYCIECSRIFLSRTHWWS